VLQNFFAAFQEQKSKAHSKFCVLRNRIDLFFANYN
jgi:hypothetical protein